MRLLSLSKHSIVFFVCLIFLPFSSESEESVDLWKENNKKKIEKLDVLTEEESKKKISILKKNQNIEILETNIKTGESAEGLNSEKPVYGIFDPEVNNFNLYMWSSTDGEEIKSIFKRINKIRFSKFTEDIFINTIMTYAYLPKNMSDNEFLDLKIDWLIKNNKISLLEEFLNKNNNFQGKEKIVEDFYLTPDYFEKDLNTKHGSGFSIQPKFSQSAYFRFHNKSEVYDGLYFVGAGTHPGAGVPGVLSSAKVLDKII